MRYLFFALLVFFAVSCSGISKKDPLPAPPNLKAELNRAEIDYRAGSAKKAMVRLARIVEKHPNTDAADDAYILMGQIYAQQGNYNEAYKSYIAVINSEYFSPREFDASLGAARALEKLGRLDEAISLTERALKTPQISPEAKYSVHVLRYDILTQVGDRLDALRSLVYLHDHAKDAAQKERYRIRAFEYVDSRLQDKELETVANDSRYSLVRAQALYRVATKYFEQRDYSRAEKYFRAAQNLTEASDVSQEIENYIKQIEARRRVAPYTIGAVLPLSGSYSARAMETLRGLQMGLGISEGMNSDFKIAVIDSAGNPDMARRAVERLVIEDSVIAIVGDILSKTSEVVAQKADELGVPVITLSQKSGLTSTGDAVFQSAVTSKALIRELVQAAMEQNGMKKFAVMYPNNGYGVEYANIFWDEVLSRGGEITAAQIYNAEEKDFGTTIQRLLGTYYLEDRADEYSQRVKDWYSKQKAITARMSVPNDILPPIIDFDALFIPDGVKALGQITSMLKYNDVNHITLLGTNIWNSPSLVSRGTSLIEGALFVDAQILVDPSFKSSPFYTRYSKLYGDAPSQFQAQAYDVGVALKHLIERGSRSRIGLRDSLSSLSGIRGASGDIRITSDREFNRNLTLLTVKDGKIDIATGPIKASVQK